MTITPALFEAFLKCQTKCWLTFTGEPPAGNTYAEWVQTERESYRADAAKRLISNAPGGEYAATPIAEELKTAKWQLAIDVPVRIELRSSRGNEAQTPTPENSQSLLTSAATVVESRLHAIERLPSEGRGKAAQFIPIRFIFTNKLGKDDKLLLAFDALVLSEVLGRQVSLGKIIHGDDHSTLKVKTPALAGEVRKRVEKIAALLSNPAPPDLVLNRHCAECEFQARCRKIAVEKDDLSLLATMSAKERQKLRTKGIFTVTQLSYTFRPRRRPKRLRDKREKYHHSLKALAIREKKIHIVGSPELKIEGTPVYLDVEGLPDRDFYYLIGLRIGNGESAVQHSLWADTVEDEGKIWREFLGVLETVDKPVLIHYGSYETNFLRRMSARFAPAAAETDPIVRAIQNSLNLLSVIFAQVYFPAVSNGLKEVAGFLGFKWSEPDAAGPRSVAWRQAWEASKNPATKTRLVTYNAEDCEALALVEQAISRLVVCQKKPEKDNGGGAEVVRTDDLKPPFAGKWRVFSSPLSELELVNKAAHWDYQRDRIYTRSNKRPQRGQRIDKPIPTNLWRVDTVVRPQTSSCCPFCRQKGIKYGPARSKTVQDIVFGRCSLKRRVIQYDYQPYWCSRCKLRFGFDQDFPKGRKPGKCKYGRNLLAFLFYQIIELHIPQRTVIQTLDRLLGLKLNPGIVASFKERLAAEYSETNQRILARIVGGGVVHVDETHVTLKRKKGYVWVFTSLHEVAYIYSDTREGELLHETLKTFKGVVVSDFYSVYDSLDCPQQKCLIHLVRDLNEALLNAPFDEELKTLVKDFGQLLRTIVEEIDRRGLKKHFLRKHVRRVDRFYRNVLRANFSSPAALAFRDRFEKNRNKLFTFLKYDGVPWNNNNAEHAIKAFARLRDFIECGATEKGIREYLILLSVCQTCKYMGVDFLDFLRSGEKDLHAFAESRRGRKRRTQIRQPTGLPADVSESAARDLNSLSSPPHQSPP